MGLTWRLMARLLIMNSRKPPGLTRKIHETSMSLAAEVHRITAASGFDLSPVLPLASVSAS
jgi:hypothetical protein